MGTNRSLRARRTLAAISLVLVGIAGPAAATTITSTSASAWKSTITNGAAVDVFGNLQNNQTYNSSSGFSLSNSSYPSAVFVATGPDNGSWNLSSRFYLYSGVNYTSLYGPSDGIGNITVTMPAGGENAFMMYLGSSSGTAITVKLSDGETFTPAAGLFGLSLSHDVSWLTISTTSGSQPVLFDLAYGSSNLTQDQLLQDPTPSIEVSTLLMIGGGLLILFGGRSKLFG